MNADEAIREQRAIRASVGCIDELHAAVSERVALREAPGEWIVMRCAWAERLFLKVGDAHVSRYVWRWQKTDATVDLLLAAAQRKGAAGKRETKVVKRRQPSSMAAERGQFSDG